MTANVHIVHATEYREPTPLELMMHNTKRVEIKLPSELLMVRSAAMTIDDRRQLRRPSSIVQRTLNELAVGCIERRAFKHPIREVVDHKRVIH